MPFDDGKIIGPMWNDIKRFETDVIIINDWTRVAKNSKEFKQTFPLVEFIGLSAQLGGQGDTITVKEFQLSTEVNSERLIAYKYRPDSFIWKPLQNSYIAVALVFDGKQLKIRHYYYFSSCLAVYHTWSTLKYDAVRFIGRLENMETTLDSVYGKIEVN